MEGTGASDRVSREAVCSGDELELGCFPFQWPVKMGREGKAGRGEAPRKLTVVHWRLNHGNI